MPFCHLTAGTGAVTLNGATEQTLSGTSVITFADLTITNTAGVWIPATNPPAVTGTLVSSGTLKQVRTVNNANVSFLTISTDKYRGVDIDTPNDLGVVTVAVRGNASQCTTNAGSPTYVKRCLGITPRNNNAVTLTLWALDSELNGISNANLALFRRVTSESGNQPTAITFDSWLAVTSTPVWPLAAVFVPSGAAPVLVHKGRSR